MKTFVRNQWYVAAYGREVTENLLARTVLGEPLALYRTSDGQVVALADRCVHRRYPLSASRVIDDQVVCGYHGFTFNKTGACTAVPGQSRIPRTARVPSFPVVEQDNFVWVFIGDPDRADVANIPRAPWLDDDEWVVVSGMEPLQARWDLLMDNLLDLSHETYLHGGYIGTPEVASTPIQTTVDDDRNIVHVSRHIADAECPPFYSRSIGLPGRITRWQDIEYHAPCLYLLHIRISEAGKLPLDDGTDPDGFQVKVVYAMTGSTPDSTYDFWAVARNWKTDDAEVSQFLHDFNRTVVMQDVVALNLLETVIKGEPEGYQELSINIDTGQLAARQMIERMAAAARAEFGTERAAVAGDPRGATASAHG